MIQMEMTPLNGLFLGFLIGGVIISVLEAYQRREITVNAYITMKEVFDEPVTT